MPNNSVFTIAGEQRQTLQVAGRKCIAESCLELQKTVLENDQLFLVEYISFIINKREICGKIYL